MMSPMVLPNVPVIRVYSPPKPSKEEAIVRRLRRVVRDGHRIIHVWGNGPKTFELAYKACVTVSHQVPLGLYDPVAVTAEWERITKARSPRLSSRASAAAVRWDLAVHVAPFRLRSDDLRSSDGSEVPRELSTDSGESVLRGERDIMYVLGQQTLVSSPPPGT